MPLFFASRVQSRFVVFSAYRSRAELERMKALGLKAVAVRGMCGLAALIFSFAVSFVVFVACVALFVTTSSGRNVAWPIIAGLLQGRGSIPFRACFQMVLSVLFCIFSTRAIVRVAH
jgi:hypothetical protein